MGYITINVLYIYKGMYACVCVWYPDADAPILLQVVPPFVADRFQKQQILLSQTASPVTQRAAEKGQVAKRSFSSSRNVGKVDSHV